MGEICRNGGYFRNDRNAAYVRLYGTFRITKISLWALSYYLNFYSFFPPLLTGAYQPFLFIPPLSHAGRILFSHWPWDSSRGIRYLSHRRGKNPIQLLAAIDFLFISATMLSRRDATSAE